jgi:hypothetical protein
MFQKNYILKAQYLGRRLESIYRVARRWKITNEEAAELMVNVEMQQSDNILNQKQHYKLFIEGSVHRDKMNPNEYNLVVEVPRIYSKYDEDVFNTSKELNNIEFNYEIDENVEILNNANKLEEKNITIYENVDGLNNNNKLEQKNIRIPENVEILNTGVANQIRKASIITKRRCTIMCSYV